MAVNSEKYTIELSGTIADFDLGGDRRVNFIQFNPGAAGDKLVVRVGSSSGPACFQNVADDASDEVRAYYYGVPMQLIIDASECTFSSGASVIIQLMAG